MQDSSYAPRDWSSHPPLRHAAYKSTLLRAPAKPLVPLRQSLTELTGPVFGRDDLAPLDDDLTKNARKFGEPIGERIVVTGRIVDEDGRAIPNTLIEIWQANAAGRYVDTADRHDAPLDPNFLGGGRCVTNEQGLYRFYTIRPGAYPWGNHANAWRPSHIHYSLFGSSIATRLVTQMYFPGDPLLVLDPIFQSTPAETRDQLISRFSVGATEAAFAIGYEFDIVLRGRAQTPMEA